MLENIQTIDQLKDYIKKCKLCWLINQSELKGPVLYRGNERSKKMIIGEGPGKEEDRLGLAFVGPAGALQDRIYAAVGWNTNTDFYMSNVLKCRPIALKGSGRQNETPTSECIAKCFIYIDKEINIIQPKLIILTGKTAITSFFPDLSNKTVKEISGKIYQSTKYQDIIFYTMYHPAAILHAQSNLERYKELRELTWQHIQQVKKIAIELGV